MAHLEKIYHRNPSRWGRIKEALRSYRLGPFSIKDPALYRFFDYGPPNASGVSVSEETALTYAAVWQAITLIAGDVGSLPLHLYKRLSGGGKERFTDHPLYYVLHDAPNPEMSSMIWRETCQGHLLGWGNSYSEIERDGGGRPVRLWPLLPTQVQPFRQDRRLKYRVTGDSGSETFFEAADILHVAGFGFDGTCGYSPIRQHRQTLGLLAAAETFGASFFGNGTTFGGALKHPKVLGDKAQQSLRESVNNYHQGADKAHRFLILEEGMDYVKFGVDPNDAQFLETRQFQIAEVARIFNLPLHKLREMEHSSVRANIEQEALDYYTSTLRPWLTRWEGELNRKLISPREKFIQFTEFNLEGVLRGDQASRYQAYATGRQWGWLSVNEIREKENLNPIPDGDMYLVPQNMAPADKIDDIVEAQTREPQPAQPAPAATPAASDGEAGRQMLARLEQQAETIGTLQARLEAAAQERDSLAVAADEARAAHAGCAAVAEERDVLLSRHVERDATFAALIAERDEQRRLAEEWQARAEEWQRDAAKLGEIAERNEAHIAALTAERDQLAVVAQTLITERDEARATLADTQAQIETRTEQAQALADTARAAEEQAAAAIAERDAAVTAKDAAERELLEARMAHDSIAAERDAFGQTLEAERQQTLAYRASLITANRTVIAETLRRLVRRETEKARAKRATPAKLLTWAESFYDEYERGLWQDALRPVMVLHQTMLGQPEAAEDVTRLLVGQHMAQSVAEIRAVADKDASEYQAALDATLQRWETQRPDAVADRLIAEEIRHGR